MQQVETNVHKNKQKKTGQKRKVKKAAYHAKCSAERNRPADLRQSEKWRVHDYKDGLNKSWFYWWIE